jgi:hypothetical protein
MFLMDVRLSPTSAPAIRKVRGCEWPQVLRVQTIMTVVRDLSNYNRNKRKEVRDLRTENQNNKKYSTTSLHEIRTVRMIVCESVTSALNQNRKKGCP